MSLYGNTEVNNNSGIFRGTSKVHVESLIIQQTGTFNNQYLRPYVTNPNLNDRDLSGIATAIADSAVNGGKNNITAMTVSGAGGSFLTRSSNPDGNAVITNGWDTPRLRFMMKVGLTNQIGGTNSIFISGYTDHQGLINGHLDPNMVFFVNSMTKTRNTVFRTNAGQSNILEQVGTQQFVTNHSNSNGFDGQSNQIHMMTPGDLFSIIGTSALYSNVDNPHDAREIKDVRFAVQRGGKAAPRSLNNANNYIANVLNSYIASSNNDVDFQSDPIQSAYTYYKNSNTFEGADIWKNEFFAALDSTRNNNGIDQRPSYFSLKDLTNLDPNVLNVTTFINANPAELHNAGSTSYWHGADLNTVAATTIASSAPALMNEQLISKIVFTSTNATIDGQIATTILFGEGFANNVDMAGNYERFKTCFNYLVAKDISFNNELSFMIRVQIDLMGQTFIKIKMENLPEQDFAYPTFCDSIFSPVVTSNFSNILHVSNDFNSLMNYVKDATVSSIPNLAAGITF